MAAVMPAMGVAMARASRKAMTRPASAERPAAIISMEDWSRVISATAAVSAASSAVCWSMRPPLRSPPGVSWPCSAVRILSLIGVTRSVRWLIGPFHDGPARSLITMVAPRRMEMMPTRTRLSTRIWSGDMFPVMPVMAFSRSSTWDQPRSNCAFSASWPRCT